MSAADRDVPSSQKTQSVDFEHYFLCKPFLRAKDKIILSHSISAIERWVPLTDIRILDVGSGDASLVEDLCKSLLDRHPGISIAVDAIEPSQEACHLVDLAGGRLRSAGVRFRRIRTTLEAFLEHNHTKYDIVLCVHVFYFLAPGHWARTVRSLCQFLSRSGLVLIDLVSRESAIYKDIWHRIEPIVKARRLRRTYATCGRLVFCEDLSRLVKLDGYMHNVGIVRATVRFSAKDVAEANRLRLAGLLQHSPLSNFLAFMFRVEPVSFSHVLAEGWDRFLPAESRELRYASIDQLIVIRGLK
jgi:2-polyprenyl-3-methyl-5-hydroxy-6-metoxy-1,4-benzoquinol methylase